MSRKLILLRHGETAYNAEGRMQGQLDVPLTDRGRLQAAAAAKALAVEDPVAIFSSDLSRAHDTALAVAAECHTTVTKDPRLRETYLGTWQGRTRVDVDQELPGHRARWRGDATWAPEGAETQIEVGARGRDFIDEITTMGILDQGTVIIVAHGGLNVALASNLLRLPVELRPVLHNLNNCCWGELITRPPHPSAAPTTEASWTVAAWNRRAPGMP